MTEYAGGKRGLVLSMRPKRYKKTSQQKTMATAADCCGIKKGITRKDLINRMRMCIPRFYELKQQGLTNNEIRQKLQSEK